MLHKIVLFLSLLGSGSYIWAQTVQVNPDHPDQYTVQEGDTLWDISGQFLVEPWRWPEIWRVNPQIEDPHLIYPGDVISMSFDGDTPILSVQRGGRSDVRSDARSADRNVKLTPTIRAEDRPQAIYSIPIDAIRHFLTRPLVVSENEMNGWPYVVSSFEEHLVSSPGIETYVSGLTSVSNIKKYSIYRQGPAYISKSGGNEETLGYAAIYVGDAEVVEYGDPATVSLVSAVKEVMRGDRLLPQSEDSVFTNFIPSTSDSNIMGSVISAEGVLTEIGQYQVIVIDKGSSDGIEVGNVLGVYQSGQVVEDIVAQANKGGYEDSGLITYLGKSKLAGNSVILPDVRAGIVMIFRTFDRISYALVMEAYTPIHLYDAVKNL